MLAKEIMHKPVVTVSPGMRLGDLAEVLSERHITGAPVVDAQGELVGVVSQTDLVRQQRESNALAAPYRARARVRDVMTPSPVCCDESTPVQELARELLRRRVHRAIITREGRVTGVVTSIDLVRALAERAPEFLADDFFRDFVEPEEAEGL